MQVQVVTQYLNEVEANNPEYNSQDVRQINIQSAFERHLGVTLDPVADLGGNLWSLDNIYAPEVWNPSGGFSGATGNGTIVAVVDTGVDLDHKEFSGRIVPGFDFVDDDSVADDGHSHGTHVAGTIAGANDGFGVTGVAYDAQIMPIRVLDNNGDGYTSDVIEGIPYAANNNACNKPVSRWWWLQRSNGRCHCICHKPRFSGCHGSRELWWFQP